MVSAGRLSGMTEYVRPSRRLMRTAPSRSATSSTAPGSRSKSRTVNVFMSDIMSAFTPGVNTPCSGPRNDWFSRSSGIEDSRATASCLREAYARPLFVANVLAAPWIEMAPVLVRRVGNCEQIRRMTKSRRNLRQSLCAPGIHLSRISSLKSFRPPRAARKLQMASARMAPRPIMPVGAYQAEKSSVIGKL